MRQRHERPSTSGTLAPTLDTPNQLGGVEFNAVCLRIALSSSVQSFSSYWRSTAPLPWRKLPPPHGQKNAKPVRHTRAISLSLTLQEEKTGCRLTGSWIFLELSRANVWLTSERVLDGLRCEQQNVSAMPERSTQWISILRRSPTSTLECSGRIYTM